MGEQQFPKNWQIGQDFDPNAHLMSLKGRDYLNVQNRLLWFIRDQRALIVAGLAKVPYVVQSELVEMDRSTGWAHFKTYVRDVLGNEATQYGSEAAKDFADFAEKASTKSLGRALLALGYGTAFAPEMDEGERVVDAPVERRQPSRAQQQQAVNELASKPAPSDEQIDLAAKLREAGMGIKAVRQFTQDHIERELDAILLSKGRETLTMGDTSKLLLELNKLANARQQQAAQQSA